MTQKRYEEIKAVLTDKKWNAAEFAAHAEKLLPELFAGIDKGSSEPSPELPVEDPKTVAEIGPVPAEEIESSVDPVGEPLPEIQDEPEERQAEPFAVDSEPAVEPSEPGNEE